MREKDVDVDEDDDVDDGVVDEGVEEGVDEGIEEVDVDVVEEDWMTLVSTESRRAGAQQKSK